MASPVWVGDRRGDGFLGIQGAKQDPVKPPPQGATSAQRNQYEQRTQDRDRRNRFVLAAGLVCGLASFREVVGGLNEKLGEDRSERFRREIENELGTLWRNAADKEGVKAIESLGLHVWLVPRWHWRFAPAAFKERLPESWKLKIPAPAMWRPGKLRHVDHLHPSGIRWRRGRGVLGRCWLERWQVQLDVQRDWGPYLNVTKPQWKQMRRDSSLDAITMKLNHGQFMRLSKLYSEVVAVPIYKTRQPSGNRYLVGCVAADMPALKENQTKRVCILTDSFETLLKATASNIEGRVKA